MAAPNAGNDASTKPVEREVIITRVFDAPRALVFKAWTDPKQVARWWGPNGFTNPVCELDARVGGAWRIVMRAPNGAEYPCGGVYREIVEPERLVFTNIAIDKEGNPILDGLTTVLFAEHGGKTTLTLQTRATAVVAYAASYLQGMEAGWTQSLDRLTGYLPKMDRSAMHRATTDHSADEPTGRAFTITRVFDAPRDLVWQACTDPECLKHWWGPKGFTWVSCKMDLRPGGLFHYCMRSPDGREMWGKFAYREIVPPERLVFVNSFSDKDGNSTRHPWSPLWPLEVLNTQTFTEHDGKTTVKLQGIPVNATEEERNTFEAGFESMQKGFAATLDQLADYLATARGSH